MKIIFRKVLPEGRTVRLESDKDDMVMHIIETKPMPLLGYAKKGKRVLCGD